MKTLSDKRFTSKCGWDVIQTEDVKEAVRRLKEFYNDNGGFCDWVKAEMDKKVIEIFGEKLI